jgi:predicted DNA binding CopG/RHH family protein
MKKKLPALKTDKEAEDFVERSDLSAYDLSGFVPMRFEFEKKSARLNMRVSQSLLKAVKSRAKARGIPYQRLIREVLEQALARR